MLFVHSKRVCFFNDSSQEVENKNVIFTAEPVIAHRQLDVLQRFMEAIFRPVRSYRSGVHREVITPGDQLVKAFIRREAIKSRIFRTFARLMEALHRKYLKLALHLMLWLKLSAISGFQKGL